MEGWKKGVRWNMLSENEITNRFRQCGMTRGAGELYLELPIALDFLATCEENNLAVIGVEGFIYHEEKGSIEAKMDYIADYSDVKTPNWEQYRNLCNHLSKDFLGHLPSKAGLVVNLVVLSEEEWWTWKLRHCKNDMSGGIGRPAVPALIEALTDEEWEVRYRAAEALSRIGEPAVPALIKALDDEDDEVRSWAAWGLGVIGEPAKRAVPVLIKALSDEHWEVQAQAAHALKEIGIPEAMKSVEEFESRMRGA